MKSIRFFGHCRVINLEEGYGIRYLTAMARQIKTKSVYMHAESPTSLFSATEHSLTALIRQLSCPLPQLLAGLRNAHREPAFRLHL